MPLSGAERETTIQVDDETDVVRLWTAQRPVIRRILSDSRWDIVEAGKYEGSPYLSATCAKKDWNPLTGMKRRVNLTEEQKRAAAERLARVRRNS